MRRNAGTRFGKRSSSWSAARSAVQGFTPALSSKTMWHLSNDYAVAARTDRGYRAPGGLDVSYPNVIESVRTPSRNGAPS